MAKALGAKVVVDTSGPALAAALKEGVFLVKPNLRELQELVGSPLDGREQQLAAARSLIENRAVETVALTLGHLGALLVTQRQAFYAPALPVKPVSVVGAGDSFLGAMVWSLDAGQSIEDGLPPRYRCRIGGAALGRHRVVQGGGRAASLPAGSLAATLRCAQSCRALSTARVRPLRCAVHCRRACCIGNPARTPAELPQQDNAPCRHPLDAAMPRRIDTDQESL